MILFHYLKSLIRLNYVWIFCLRKQPHLLYIFNWSFAPPPTAESSLRREWTERETHSPWLRRGYNTCIKSKISNLCQILIFITQSNRVKKFFPLNTIDPQPPPSSTYKIKGWALFCKSRLDNTLGIRLGLSDPPIRPSQGQSSVLQAIDYCCQINDCSTTRVLS